MFDPSEFGQVFAQIGSGGEGVYADVKGVERDFEQLSASYVAMSAGSVANTSEPYLTRTQGQEWDFGFTFVGVTTYTVRIMAHRVGGAWEPIQTRRSDTGVVAKEHAVPSGMATLLLQTTSAHIREQARVEVKAAGSPVDGDTVTCYCRAI